jgi:hypothetical protein
MTDEASPLGWRPRPQTGPRWLPNAPWDGGLTPPSAPNDPSGVQSSPIWVETPSGGLHALHPNGANWVETPNGGLLAVHPQPRTPPERGNSDWWDSIAPGAPFARLPAQASPILSDLPISGVAGWHESEPTIAAARSREQSKIEEASAPGSSELQHAMNFATTSPEHASSSNHTLAAGRTPPGFCPLKHTFPRPGGYTCIYQCGRYMIFKTTDGQLGCAAFSAPYDGWLLNDN